MVYPFSNKIGVVVIGRNEGARLIECLKSVRSASANIIYVDSDSFDQSVSSAEAMGINTVRLDPTRPLTAARARNEGFFALRAVSPNIQFVQFIDGDCILAQSWIENGLAFLEQQANVAIVCGRRRERYASASIYNQLIDEEWNTSIGENTACGGDALVRVEAFEKVGGFRPWLIAGEEPEMCLRLQECGWKVWRLNHEMTQHDADIHRFSQWWLRSVRSGYGFAEVSRLHQASARSPWRKNVLRSVLWAGVVPVVFTVGTLIYPFMSFGILIYPIQVVRLAAMRGVSRSASWWYAILSVPEKFAQLHGILKFCWRNWRQQTSSLIEYKGS